MKIEWKNLFRTIAVLEALLLLVMLFSLGSKIDKQKEEIKILKKEIEEVKPCYYECYKKIELKAERSGK